MPNKIGNQRNKQGVQGTRSGNEAGASSRNPVRNNAMPTPAPVSGQQHLAKINAGEYDNLHKMLVEVSELEKEKNKPVKDAGDLIEIIDRETDDSRLVILLDEMVRIEKDLLPKQKELLSAVNSLRSKVRQFKSTRQFPLGNLKEESEKTYEFVLTESIVRQMIHHNTLIRRFQHIIASKKNLLAQPFDPHDSKAVELRDLNQKLIQANFKKQVEESKKLVKSFEDIPEEKRNQKHDGYSANDIVVHCFINLINDLRKSIIDASKKADETQEKFLKMAGCKEVERADSLVYTYFSHMNEMEKKELRELYTPHREALVELFDSFQNFRIYLEKFLALPLPEEEKSPLQEEKKEKLRAALNGQYALINIDVNLAYLSHNQAKSESNGANKLDETMNLLVLYRAMTLNAYDEYQKNQSTQETTISRENHQIAQSLSIICEEIARVSSYIASQLEYDIFPQKDVFQNELKNIESGNLNFQRLLHEELDRLIPADPLEDMDNQQSSSKEDDGDGIYLQNLFEKHFIKQDMEEAVANIADSIEDINLINESAASENEAAKHGEDEHAIAEQGMIAAGIKDHQSGKLYANTDAIKKLERKLDRECKWHERKAAEYRDKASEQIALQSLSSMQMYMRSAVEETRKIAANRMKMANEFQSTLSGMEKDHPDYEAFLDKEAQLRKEAVITAKMADDLTAEGRKLLVNAIRGKCVDHPPSSNDFRTLYEMGAIAKIVPSPRKVDDKLDKDGNVLKNPYTDEPAKDYFQNFEIHLKGEAQMKDGALSFAPVKKGTKKDIRFVAHFHYKDADSEDVIEAHFKTKEQANKGRLYVMSEQAAGRDTKIYRNPFKKSGDVIHIIKTMSEDNTQDKGKRAVK